MGSIVSPNEILLNGDAKQFLENRNFKEPNKRPILWVNHASSNCP